jgi:DNA uptake protein ComE-like DNA-binding protein
MSSQKIFISYRRSDCQSQANALNESLRHRLPDADVFMDLDSIPLGADFEDYIRDYIEGCDIVLVLIGDEWLEPQPGSSLRRIDAPNDFVRLEVMTALQGRDVTVIPVLVEGATMPGVADLPDDIARLARLNAYTLSDSHWPRDVGELANHLRGGPLPEAESSPTGASVTFADIDVNAVKYAVADLPHQFATKDVSTHPVMMATHEGVAERGNYHTIVGRFLMQHRSDLGLGSPEAAQGDRGSRWTKVRSSGGPVPPPQFPTPPSKSAPARVHSPAPQMPHQAPTATPSSSAGKWMIALPIISCGLLGFVPPLWASTRVKHDPERKRRLQLMAGALGVGTVLAFALIGASPTDAEGSPTGAASSIGSFVALACMVAGVVIAVKNRNPAPALAGTAQALEKRDLREQYRQLVTRDPSLAGSMRVGRPDLGREYDDGGLVDFNSMPAEGLQRFAGLSGAEAAAVVRTRGELGRFSSLSELEAFANLSQSTVARLREIAVFV